MHPLTPLQADNQDVNTKLKEQLAKERAKAAIRASKSKGQKRPAEDSPAAVSAKPTESADDNSDDEEGQVHEPEKKRRAKKPKVGVAGGERRTRPKRNPNKR